MNFNEIRQEAEETREETYGLRVGSDRFGYDAVAFVSNVRNVNGSEIVEETEHEKLKREKAENVAHYRAQDDRKEEIIYNGPHCDEVAQHRAELAWVAGMVRAGLIDAEDLTDGDL